MKGILDFKHKKTPEAFWLEYWQNPQWMVLLGACRIHGNVEMAKCIAKLLKWGLRMMLSSIYVIIGNMHFCENVEQQWKENGVKK